MSHREGRGTPSFAAIIQADLRASACDSPTDVRRASGPQVSVPSVVSCDHLSIHVPCGGKKITKRSKAVSAIQLPQPVIRVEDEPLRRNGPWLRCDVLVHVLKNRKRFISLYSR